MISIVLISEPADILSTITIEAVGGRNDSTCASVPFGCWIIFCHAMIGITHRSMTGVIRLWVSLIVLQIEPIPTMIELKKRNLRATLFSLLGVDFSVRCLRTSYRTFIQKPLPAPGFIFRPSHILSFVWRSCSSACMNWHGRRTS